MGNGASGGPPGPGPGNRRCGPQFCTCGLLRGGGGGRVGGIQSGIQRLDVGSGGDFSCGRNENFQPNAGK